MRCEQIRGWADEYLDGILSDERKREMERHLDSCPTCTQYIKEWRQMLMLVSDLEEEELPPGFEQRLHHLLQQASREEEVESYPDRKWVSGGNRWVKWGAGLAAVLALVFSIYWIQPFGFMNPGDDGNLSAQDKAAEESTDYQMHSTEMERPLSDSVPAEPSSEMRQNDTPITSSGESDTGNESIRKLPADIYLYVSKAGYNQEEIPSIAADFHMNVVQQQNNQIKLQIAGETQIDAFLERLSELGQVETSGWNEGEETIIIQVIVE